MNLPPVLPVPRLAAGNWSRRRVQPRGDRRPLQAESPSSSRRERSPAVWAALHCPRLERSIIVGMTFIIFLGIFVRKEFGGCHFQAPKILGLFLFRAPLSLCHISIDWKIVQDEMALWRGGAGGGPLKAKKLDGIYPRLS